MNELYYEKLLGITTIGNQKVNKSNHYNIYEPTTYNSLELLTSQINITENDNFIDFGCGKGRLNFYMNYKFNCSTTGIEMNKYYYNDSLDNKKKYMLKNKNKGNNIKFLNILAEDYLINDKDNIFYFFNPFTVEIFSKVINNILLSLERNYRKITIILYYPLNDYIYFIEDRTPFFLEKEIINTSLYHKDNNHKFLIYSNYFSSFNSKGDY